MECLPTSWSWLRRSLWRFCPDSHQACSARRQATKKKKIEINKPYNKMTVQCRSHLTGLCIHFPISKSSWIGHHKNMTDNAYDQAIQNKLPLRKARIQMSVHIISLKILGSVRLCFWKRSAFSVTWPFRDNCKIKMFCLNNCIKQL